MQTDPSYLEEYRSLREEIMRRQQGRLLVLGFTVTAIGTILGLALKERTEPLPLGTHCGRAFMVFAMLLLIAALVITSHHTRQIKLLSSFIRAFIEPRVVGIRWESKWNRYRDDRLAKSRVVPAFLSMSQSLAIYYGLLTVTVVGVHIAARFCTLDVCTALVAALAFMALWLAQDLYRQRRRAWTCSWTGLVSQ